MSRVFENIMENFIERLKSARLAAGLSQTEVAMASGIVLRSYQRYEKGERLPDAEALKCICQTLNVSADYLLGLKEE